MKVIGLLSFYDEPVQDLVACVHGLAGAGVEHLVALDGAYALYPGGEAASHPNQHAALHLACRQLGMGLTIQAPATVWDGNEVAKRSYLFALGLAVSEPGDWFLVIDADEVVTRAAEDLRARLAATELDAAEVQILDTMALRAKRKNWPPYFTMRRLFRAQPMHVETNHITYVADDGRMLCNGDLDERPLEPHLDLANVFLIEHRPDGRPAARQDAKMEYYATRNELGVERGSCSWCTERAVRLVACDWTMNAAMGAPVARWREACAKHGRDAEIIGEEQLRALGADPTSIENRNGRPVESVAA